MPLPPRPIWMPNDAALRARLTSGALSYPYYRTRLAEYVCRLLPGDGSCALVDIGSGEGLLAGLIRELRPQTTVVGVETFIRSRRERKMDVVKIDGHKLPFVDRAFDVALLLNVLHHAIDPRQLLLEARRVTRRRVIVKDHVANSWLQYQQLALLDVLGNAGSGAVVRGRYLSDEGWHELLTALSDARIVRHDGLSFRRGPLKVLFPDELEVMFDLELI